MACLGAFVIFVFLVLIITFILRKNKKPTHRNVDSPEARERMLEGASIPSNTQIPQQVVPNLSCPTNLQQVNCIVLYVFGCSRVYTAKFILKQFHYLCVHFYFDIHIIELHNAWTVKIGEGSRPLIEI